LVQDQNGFRSPANFFTATILEGRHKPGQLLVLYGKVKVDWLRPARIEMVNPQFELLSSIHFEGGSEEGQDSTEVGRIYKAIRTFGPRAIRRSTYAALRHPPPRSSPPPSASAPSHLHFAILPLRHALLRTP